MRLVGGPQPVHTHRCMGMCGEAHWDVATGLVCHLLKRGGRHPQVHEGRDGLAELLWIDHCGELLDDPFLDQGVDPGAGMRSGDAQLAGDIGIGHAAIFDQQVQQFSIGRVH